jgi:hypothetical protein
MNGKPGVHEHGSQNVIEERVKRSHQGTMSFGEVVAKLMEWCVETYRTTGGARTSTPCHRARQSR